MRTTHFILLYLFACSLLSAAKPPNILFAVADDWGPHAGAYGTDWVKTPSFDRVAEQGLLFTRAYTPNAKCAPSRACILTGRNSWQLKAAANHWCFFPPEFKTWCEALAEHGWNVGYTQKGWAPGIALDEDGKPRQLTGNAWNKQRAKPPTKAISNNDYAANFEDFLDAAPEDEPWVFWYGAGEPHRSYEFGSSLKQGRSTVWHREHVLIGKERHDIGRPHDWAYPIRGIVKDDLLYLRNYEPERWPAGNPETGYLNSDGGATKTEVIEAGRRDRKNPNWQLCFGKRPKEELYDLSNDPHCLDNLMDEVSAKNPTQIADLTRLLESELKRQQDPRIMGNGEVLENYLYADHATDFDWQTDTLADKVHPNAAGAKKMSECWMEALEPLVIEN